MLIVVTILGYNFSKPQPSKPSSTQREAAIIDALRDGELTPDSPTQLGVEHANLAQQLALLNARHRAQLLTAAGRQLTAGTPVTGVRGTDEPLSTVTGPARETQ